MECPCSNTLKFENCCEPYLSGETVPLTPEKLMRSRYTAFTLGDVLYLKNTMRGKALKNFNELEVKKWLERVTWLGLTVLKVRMKSPTVSYVSFIARFKENEEQTDSIREKSKFIKVDGKWYYIDAV